MKTWAVKIQEGLYLKNLCNNNVRWHPNAIGTDDVTLAKHYKTKASAKSTMKSRATKRRNWADMMLKRITEREAQGNRAPSYMNDQYNGYITSADYIDKFVVVEVDVEKPSWMKDLTPDVKFERSRSLIGFKTKKSQGNCYCKGCGVYFKKIPFLQFGASSRICPLCIQEHFHEAEKLLSEMPEEQRLNYEAERFAHKMG